MAISSARKVNVPSRYEETGTSFKGGFGEVHVLRDRFLDRLVAYKTTSDAHDVDQLEAEVLAISEIRSKNVVEIYDLIFHTSGHLIGIIEEYLPGSDLLNFVDIPYDRSRYLQALYQISSAIADIHGHGLVHRDIKLNNLKQDAEGIIKLFDFGLSSQNAAHTTVGARATMVYAAPELYTAPLKIERMLDTYAFGVCCWTLRSRKLPNELLERPPQRTGRVPSLLSVDSKFPADLAACLDSTLHPDPMMRPSMPEVRDTIGRHILYGRHRAWLTGGHLISSPGQTVSITNSAVGKISIGYDGLRFFVAAIEGDVYINNDKLSVSKELPKSCVITLGAPSRGALRQFVQFNVSHPEIIL